MDVIFVRTARAGASSRRIQDPRAFVIELCLLAVLLPLAFVLCRANLDLGPAKARAAAEDAVQHRYYDCLWFKSPYYNEASESVAERLDGGRYRVTLRQIPYTGAPGDVGPRPLEFFVSATGNVGPADPFTTSYIAMKGCSSSPPEANPGSAG